MNRRRTDKSNHERHTGSVPARELLRRTNVTLIIDGYNLMHVTRFKPVRDNDAGELRRCREGMLSLLAEHLPADRFRQITVVFDSQHAPTHLPEQTSFRHLDVQFARNENSADDQIAILIGKHPTPKRLIVVSSDHRVQVATRRRRANWIDSDRWIEAVLEQDWTAESEAEIESDDESVTMSEKELSEFRSAMAGEDSGEEQPNEPESNEPAENPFPDGYFDDLEDD